MERVCGATPLAVSTLTFPPPSRSHCSFFLSKLERRAKQLTHAWGLHEMCDPSVPSPIGVCSDCHLLHTLYFSKEKLWKSNCPQIKDDRNKGKPLCLLTYLLMCSHPEDFFFLYMVQETFHFIEFLLRKTNA